MLKNSDQWGPFVGIGGLAVVAFLYGWSAIVLPGWLNSLVLPLLWLVLFALACSWFTRRPRAAALLPVVALASWFAVVVLPYL